MTAARSIPFLGELVLELLAGRKTVTRRTRGLKNIRIDCDDGVQEQPTLWRTDGHGLWIPYCRLETTAGLGIPGEPIPCPYGVPGDRLWVGEALRRAEWNGEDDAVQYVADGEFAWDVSRPAQWGWKLSVLPSIFCPRGLSRITLDLTDVRVERLLDITEDDAQAEGVQRIRIDHKRSSTYRESFLVKWDEINGAGAAAKNPWCWRLEFRRADGR